MRYLGSLSDQKIVNGSLAHGVPNKQTMLILCQAKSCNSPV